jgi:hypothetical protein
MTEFEDQLLKVIDIKPTRLSLPQVSEILGVPRSTAYAIGMKGKEVDGKIYRLTRIKSGYCTKSVLALRLALDRARN